MRQQDLHIVAAEDTSGGRQRAKRLTLMVESERGPIKFRAKWRALSTSHGLNDPRRELAAYLVQKQFLPSEDFVAPPTVGHCFDIAKYRGLVDATESASFPGTSCVFGTLSYWLEDTFSVAAAYTYGRLRSPQLLDTSQFARVLSYRRSLANTNLLTSLISAGDTHSLQFVISGGPRTPHVYSVDHTISFSDFRNPKLGLDDYWSMIIVPALPRDSIARLRALGMDDFERLLVLEQYENRDGLLIPTTPTPPAGPTELGFRWNGKELQVGLTTPEIDLLWNRTQELLERIERGQIPLF